MNQNSIRVSITALTIIQCACKDIVLAHEDYISIKKVNTEKPFLAENFVSMSHFKFLFPVLPVSVWCNFFVAGGSDRERRDAAVVANPDAQAPEAGIQDWSPHSAKYLRSAEFGESAATASFLSKNENQSWWEVGGGLGGNNTFVGTTPVSFYVNGNAHYKVISNRNIEKSLTLFNWIMQATSYMGKYLM